MKEEKFPQTMKPLHWWRRGVGRRVALEPLRRAQQPKCRGQSEKIPKQKFSANQHSPASVACLLTMGAETLASEVRSQGEDWGWLHEHSLRGLVPHS